MIFVRQRRTKQRHDAIAHDLIDCPLVAVHRFHHVFQHRIENFRASSGSRSASNSIEPFISANNTVTCLRSPSRALLEVRIFSARCLGV